MRTIRTSRDKEYPVDYCGIGYAGMLKMQLRDSRPLGQIAPEFEGLGSVTYTDGGAEPEAFEGFTRLNRLEWIDGHSVAVLLAKDEGDEEVL